MVEHGGRLRAAAAQWGVPLADWLDLSTGIAPWPYSVPPLPAEVWQRLPEDEDGLEAAARAYYGARQVLTLAGSQAAIQLLPQLFPHGRVAMPTPLYAEHPACWRAAGHAVVAWNAPADYAVLCNPNNPTGQRYTRDELLERSRSLRLLLVDEAFIDAAPEQSLANHTADNIVVLRSLGKFFGLAGARVGCAIAAPALLDKLREALGPWALSHPGRWAARHALVDTAWQAAQSERLQNASLRLDALLKNAGHGDATGTALFRYVATPRAAAIHDALARRGILLRLFDDPPALRFGLPGNEPQWQRLTDTLKEIS
jgi:cobalamin biosynthetic protein CobC